MTAADPAVPPLKSKPALLLRSMASYTEAAACSGGTAYGVERRLKRLKWRPEKGFGDSHAVARWMIGERTARAQSLQKIAKLCAPVSACVHSPFWQIVDGDLPSEARLRAAVEAAAFPIRPALWLPEHDPLSPGRLSRVALHGSYDAIAGLYWMVHLARRRADECEALRIARFLLPALQVRAALGLGALLAEILFARLCASLLGDLCDGKHKLDLAQADVANGARAFAWSGAVDAAGGWALAPLPLIYTGRVSEPPEQAWVSNHASPLATPGAVGWNRPLSTLCEGTLAKRACETLRQTISNYW